VCHVQWQQAGMVGRDQGQRIDVTATNTNSPVQAPGQAAMREPRPLHSTDHLAGVDALADTGGGGGHWLIGAGEPRCVLEQHDTTAGHIADKCDHAGCRSHHRRG
jgi:hypothetical protein